tara:strand:+ start:2041 stop:2160 length:120 start_codon:yes stop_codon:yes gene_type:complete
MMAKEYQGLEIMLVGFSQEEADKFKDEFDEEFLSEEDDE